MCDNGHAIVGQIAGTGLSIVLCEDVPRGSWGFIPLREEQSCAYDDEMLT